MRCIGQTRSARSTRSRSVRKSRCGGEVWGCHASPSHPISSLLAYTLLYHPIPSSQPFIPPHPTIPLSRPASHSPHPHRLGRLPCLPVPYQYLTPLRCAALHCAHTVPTSTPTGHPVFATHVRLHVAKSLQFSVQRDRSAWLPGYCVEGAVGDWWGGLEFDGGVGACARWRVGWGEKEGGYDLRGDVGGEEERRER